MDKEEAMVSRGVPAWRHVFRGFRAVLITTAMAVSWIAVNGSAVKAQNRLE